MVTIRLACEKLKTHNLEGCVIYTSCEPCPMCLGAIYWAHLDHIYFSHSKSDAKDGKKKTEKIFEEFFSFLLVGFDDHFIYEELARELHERRVGVTQLLKDESKAFSMWTESQQKIHY
jgi:guanine deaminase